MYYEQFKRILPKCKDPEGWYIAIGNHLEEFNIVTPEQIAMFLAQIGHESLDMNVLTENFNYSADRLKVVFPKYFRNRDANQFHRKPEAIANIVYANRMGNGSPESGDGWKYRGRGLIMITGRYNYSQCSEYLYSDSNILINRPELLSEDKEVAILSALWFWQKHNLQDISGIRESTRIINGGQNGIEDRISRFERALDILSDS
jgi:putative chitinase